MTFLTNTANDAASLLAAAARDRLDAEASVYEEMAQMLRGGMMLREMVVICDLRALELRDRINEMLA